jgi:fumarylacetoacetase
MTVNATHSSTLRSWVPSADRHPEFPIQNLPLGVFSVNGDAPRIGTAIGDYILDLRRCAEESLLPVEVAEACAATTLNPLMACGAPAWDALRLAVSALLTTTSPPRPALLTPQADATMHLPAAIGDYTDGYASVHHARRVGALFRPDAPLLPNYRHVPIAYHGRASSLVVSGTPVRRPNGQTSADLAGPPRFGPCANLDYEAEIGMLVGPGNQLGAPIPIAAAGEQIFGLCLVNDWSARDIQRWEYQPLGPFLSKSFATTLGPWVVTSAALAPFRVPATHRPPDEPRPLPYLWDDADQGSGNFAITVEVWLATPQMRAAGQPAVRISQGSFADTYWTFAQMLTHHSSAGCNLRPGDLIASGTISGPEVTSGGCLLELTAGGKTPIALPNGEQRRYLEDGDQVIMRGCCRRAGWAQIGFGWCAGEVRG